ncbi:hypothetical protein IV102_01880 [bacterium]|nr:hypothetical protein [bacterium]
MNITPNRPMPSAAQSAQFSLKRQDPSVKGSQIDWVSLQVEVKDHNLQSADFELTDRLEANRQGQYVYEVQDPERFVPASILANLQRNFDLFKTYCDLVPPNWSSGQVRLPIYPDYDQGFNCFYSNGHSANMHQPGFYFFHNRDPITRQMVYAGMSSELVAHEQGHAILDRFRPQYNEPGFWSFEGAAFLEAFSDVFCLLMHLKMPGMAAQVIEETGGDLCRHNSISDLAEEFGTGINHRIEAMGGKPDHNGGPWLRTAINDQVWVDPAQLPKQPTRSPQELWADAHSFSQIWTGATYEILQKMTARLSQSGLSPTGALEQANEELLKIYGKFVSKTAPTQKFSYRDAALSLLEADRLLGREWGVLIEEVMIRRKIL